ncbi:copper resistance protein B [Alcanivorax sp. S6407]|uniref:copper resistance protein B n=1 Tax=Alcanivorax sp. S6407 TaxID=2926424 RepID=UPI001FF49A99|nr:copper resistance protein B [Alcanivorax sp. S6407]MCK0153706.1 copper resistance protein B [Alcanivorax sp. S6407]
MKKLLPVMALTLSAQSAFAMSEHPMRVGQVIVDQLEVRDTDEGRVLAWEVDGWYGSDINKLYFSSNGERLMAPEHDDEDPATESADTRLAWSRALSPFWDGQLGVRRDWQPDDPNRDWASIGIKGLAPYQFDVDAHLFIGDDSLTNLQLSAEYELMLTQKLVLVPALEANFYGKEDAELGVGKGLTDIEAGLRLRYEIRREIAPYIGVNWEKQYGDTADFTRASGGKTEEGMLVAGIRFWF